MAMNSPTDRFSGTAGMVRIADLMGNFAA